MKRFVSLIIFRLLGGMFLLFLFLVSVFSPAVSRGEVLEPIDIVTGEWKPYTSMDMENYGLASEIVTRVLRRMGYQPNYIFMSFDRAYDLALKSDTNDDIRGTFPFWKMPFLDENDLERDRRREMYFSEPLTKIKTKLVIFYNSNQEKESKLKNAEKISELSWCTILTVKGYAYPEEILNLIRKKLLKKESVDTELEAFQKLSDPSKPYIVLSEERVGRQILNDEFAETQEDIAFNTKIKYEQYIYFIASLKNPNNSIFINRFNDNLQKLKKQGIIDALESKYFKGPVVNLNSPETSLIPAGNECNDDSK